MTTSNNVYISREFSCSKSRLFKWLVEPGLITKWFGPKNLTVKNVQSYLKVNGTYSVELLKPDGTFFYICGTYLEIEAPDKLKFSFGYSGLDRPPPESIVEITLKEINQTLTELSLIQRFETIPSDIDNRTKSWESMFEKLSEELRIVTKGGHN
ncbi:MAG: SRPBCC family protein [Aurantibacter sp.]